MGTGNEELIRHLLLRAEALYEQLGTALVESYPRRRGWAFIRALGATRLAGELGVSREEVVAARRRALQRWTYWFWRYERPLWQEIVDLDPQRWEQHFVHYRTVRTALRTGKHVDDECVLAALALRSLGTTTWRVGINDGQWRDVWRLFQRGQDQKARKLAAELGWSAVHLRRARRTARQLQSLVGLPWTQRQMLALSTWPAKHLRALQLTGRALFPGKHVSLGELAVLKPRDLLCLPKEHTL